MEGVSSLGAKTAITGMVQKARRARTQPAPAQAEIGTTGLRHYGGFVVEEWLATLAGRRGAWVYREMADNDSVIGAILFAIDMLVRSVEWTVIEGGDPAAAELVESCMDDMSHTWADFVSEMFGMVVYGWSYHEIVYKRRLGPDPRGTDGNGKPLPGSRYDDGKVGWRKLPVRAQETLERWEIDPDDSGLAGMTQVAYDGVRRTIPISKALLFRTTTRRGNPEGRSILRNAYLSWFRVKNIEEIEAIGIERDLAGIPVVRAPDGFIWNEEDPAAKRLIDAARELVTSIRRDEDEGVVLPPGWELDLLTTGGSRQLDTDKIVRRYQLRIASIVLADFILLAQDKVGSRSLGEQKVATFQQALQVFLGLAAEVLNRYAIPRLLRLNGMSVVDPPRFVPGDIDEMDLEKIGAFFVDLAAAGAPIDWTHDLLVALFTAARLPEPDEPAEDAEDAPPPPVDREIAAKLRAGRRQDQPAPDGAEQEVATV